MYTKSINNFIKLILLILIYASIHSLTFASSDEDSQQFFKAYLNRDGPVQKVDIMVDSFYFKPDHIEVLLNEPVQIRLRSVTSLIEHEFTLKAPVSGIYISRDIPHGIDVTVRFTPTKTGDYEFYCDKKAFFGLFSHKNKGMKGILKVVQYMHRQ